MATRVEEASPLVLGQDKGVNRVGHDDPVTEDATGHHHALQHHFDNLEQQKDATTIGMWTFLVTEIMFFGGLFFAYTLYRARDPEAFNAGSAVLNITLGTTNTAILIGSSLTMAMAVYFAQIGKRTLLVIALIATTILGTAFLGIKAVEYTEKFSHNTYPGARPFQIDSKYIKEFEEHHKEPFPPASRVQMFYVIYYGMTGIHALHMIIGIGALLVLTYYAMRGAYTPEYNSPIELTGLYWHFVDIIWIFLFPLLYLIGRH